MFNLPFHVFSAGVLILLVSCSIGSKRGVANFIDDHQGSQSSYDDYYIDKLSRYENYNEQCFDNFTSLENYILNDDNLQLKQPKSVIFEFTPTIFYFEGSTWDKSLIIKELEKTSKTLLQCGVSMHKVRLIQLTSPTGNPDFSIQKKDPFNKKSKCSKTNEDLSKLLDPKMKPAIFLVRDLYFADGIAYGGTPMNESFWGPELAGTIWVGEGAIYAQDLNEDHEAYISPTQSTITHEIGHLLSLQHDQRKENTMTIPYRFAKGNFNPTPFIYSNESEAFSQCQRIQKSKYLKKLL